MPNMEEDAYPVSVLFIIASEFCERFSFCGLRTILSLYLRNELHFTESTATVIYHVFIAICYIVPIAGAICADSILGRYRTILYFSIVYLAGNIFMCLAVFPLGLSPITMTILGLTLIATGTGGIKPCVAAFGGEQFHLPKQQILLQQYFSIFYFTINLGGFIGMVVTPILRKGFSCFGKETCYALGFGFPAALMGLALLLLIVAKPWYRVRVPKENVILNFLRCTYFALKSKMESRGPKESHWLDYAAKLDFRPKLIADMKIVFSMLVLYAPLPVFSSLFDQQGSSWTFQASRMDGLVLGTHIVPDQMQVINPAIVIILIPLFDKIIYPILHKVHLLDNPLHRMALGGLAAGMAFLAAGILELFLQNTYPKLPGNGKANLIFINTLPCNATVYNPFNDRTIVMDMSAMYKFINIDADNTITYNVTVQTSTLCDYINFNKNSRSFGIKLAEHQTDIVLIGINIEGEVEVFATDSVDFQKSFSGKPRVRIVYMKDTEMPYNVTVALEGKAGLSNIYFTANSSKKNMAVSSYMELPIGEYEFKVRNGLNAMIYKNKINLSLGGVYELVLREHLGEMEFVKIYTMTPPNTINIFWLTPQYFLISVAEIMFAIAGLEFSFTQAPKSLRTVTIAAWYLTVALGNLFVILVIRTNTFTNNVYQFFFFALLIVTDMAIFIQMSVNYRFVQLEADSSVCVVLEEIPLLESTAALIPQEISKSTVKHNLN